MIRANMNMLYKYQKKYIYVINLINLQELSCKLARIKSNLIVWYVIKSGDLLIPFFHSFKLFSKHKPSIDQTYFQLPHSVTRKSLWNTALDCLKESWKVSQTHHRGSAAACSLGFWASSSGSHQWLDRFFPEDHLEAWTCTEMGWDQVWVKRLMSCLQMNTSFAALLVIGKGVHQQPFLDELLPLRVLRLQVSVVVVGHDDPICVEGQLDDVAIIVAHHPLPVNETWRRVHQDLPPLQLMENMLV